MNFRRVKDTRPLEAGDLIQCRKCHDGIERGKRAGSESGCTTVFVSSLLHKGKVIAAVTGSFYVTVRYKDSNEPVKVLRTDLVRIAS